MTMPGDPELIPPALVAEIRAAAAAEHRPVAEVVQDALERYLAQRRKDASAARSETTLPRRTATEAAARLRERRKGTVLPDGVTIRDLMTHGRA